MKNDKVVSTYHPLICRIYSIWKGNIEKKRQSVMLIPLHCQFMLTTGPWQSVESWKKKKKVERFNYVLSKFKRVNKQGDTPFTRKKSENYSKRVKFHSKKSKNQPLFTPTQKRVVPNSTLFRVTLSLKKKLTLSRVESLFLSRVKIITLSRVKITHFWVEVKSNGFSHYFWVKFHPFGLIFTLFFFFFEWNFTLHQVRHSR